MTPGEYAVLLAVAWLALTLLFQFRPLSGRFQLLDRLGMLPRWLFFAQGVGSAPVSLEVRLRAADGAWGVWQAAPLWPPRHWRHALFYPEGPQTGALWIAMDRLAQRAERGDDAATLAASRACATLCVELARALPEQRWQFAIVRRDPAGGQVRRLFISDMSGP